MPELADGSRERDAHAEVGVPSWPADQLRPGDVLFARGSAALASPISDWICLLDGGRYSHVALWDGSQVLEASGHEGRVRPSSLDELLDEHEYTHVYRRRGLDAGSAGLSEVIEVARAQCGAGYPHVQLRLLGMMIGMGRVVGHPALEGFLRVWGDAVARVMSELGRGGQTRVPLTCSQFVALAFFEADRTEDRRYALAVRYPARGPWRDATPRSDPELPHELQAQVRQIEAECRALFPIPATSSRRSLERDPAKGRRGERAIGIPSQLVIAGAPRLPLSCVTPRDLEDSPSLEFLGELQK